MLLNVFLNVHFGPLYFKIFKLVLNVGKMFHFGSNYWIWLVSSSNVTSLKLCIVLKEYFLYLVGVVNKRGQISPNSRLLVSWSNNQSWLYLSRFKFECEKFKVTSSSYKSFELEIKYERNMTKFNSLGPKWNILPIFRTKTNHFANI